MRNKIQDLIQHHKLLKQETQYQYDAISLSYDETIVVQLQSEIYLRSIFIDELENLILTQNEQYI